MGKKGVGEWRYRKGEGRGKEGEGRKCPPSIPAYAPVKLTLSSLLK